MPTHQSPCLGQLGYEPQDARIYWPEASKGLINLNVGEFNREDMLKHWKRNL